MATEGRLQTNELISRKHSDRTEIVHQNTLQRSAGRTYISRIHCPTIEIPKSSKVQYG